MIMIIYLATIFFYQLLYRQVKKIRLIMMDKFFFSFRCTKCSVCVNRTRHALSKFPAWISRVVVVVVSFDNRGTHTAWSRDFPAKKRVTMTSNTYAARDLVTDLGQIWRRYICSSISRASPRFYAWEEREKENNARIEEEGRGGRWERKREREGQRALWHGDATATPPQLLAEVSHDEGKQREQRGRKEKEAGAHTGRAYSRGTDR